jgi:hypothetical protein
MMVRDIVREQATLTEIIEQLISADPETRNTAAARLLDCSSTEEGLDALLGLAFDKQCDELIHTVGDAERHSVATCMSRMGCYLVMGKAQLDKETLDACLEEYQNANIGVKLGMLRAIGLFAVANKDKVALLEETNWVALALSCEKDCHGPAMVFLDSLDSLGSLPDLFMRAAGTEGMLVNAMRGFWDTERLAALRLTSRLMSSLEQGVSSATSAHGVSHVWLSKLRKVRIVEAVVACIKRCTTVASLQYAVRTLTELSKHKVFVEDVRGAEVIRIILDVLGKGRAIKEILVLLCRILRFNRVADKFTSTIGPQLCLNLLAEGNLQGDLSRDILSVFRVWLHYATSSVAANTFAGVKGPKVCIAMLDKANLQEAQEILALLVSWFERYSDHELVENQRLDWSPVVRFLGVQDLGIVAEACALILWDRSKPTSHEGKIDSVINKLVENNAIRVDVLLYAFAASPLVDRHIEYALLGIKRLIRKLGEDDVALFCGDSVMYRLLGLANSDMPVRAALSLSCLGLLASYRTDVMRLVVMTDIFGVGVRHLQAQQMRDGYFYAYVIPLILGMMNALLMNADRHNIPVYYLAGAGIPTMKALFKVSLSARSPS